MSEKKRLRIFWIIQITITLVFFTIVYITIFRPLESVRNAWQDALHERAEVSEKKNYSETVDPVSLPPVSDPDADIQRNVTSQEPSETKNGVNEMSPAPPPVAKEQDSPEKSVSPVEQPSEKNKLSPEEYKAFVEAAEAVSEEAKAIEAEMWEVFKPLLPQLVARLNELSADEQLAVIEQMRANLRDIFSSEGTVTESTLDEMTGLFFRKMEDEGFIRRF
ncbi:hypothetical protein F4141_06065 [Candidatus Poribacteria bacterium]|nr:hypothetical protein [Candidatus Poribacteria bacterium]